MSNQCSTILLLHTGLGSSFPTGSTFGEPGIVAQTPTNKYKWSKVLLNYLLKLIIKKIFKVLVGII